MYAWRNEPARLSRPRGSGRFAGGGCRRRGAGTTLKSLHRDMPLAERIRLMQTFVHQRYYDNIGLLYSHVNFEEERPHAPGELAGHGPQ